jgi:O-Antigen ligase
VSRREIAAAAFAVPPLGLLAFALALALRGGGVEAEQWQALAAGVVASLLVLAAVGAVPSVPRAAWPMIACLAALIVWSAISLSWSESRPATVEGVARLLLLAAAAFVGAAYAGPARAALALSTGLALFGGLLAVLIEAELLTGTASAFAAGRLSWPISYANADAALVWLPLPPLLAFAAFRPLHPAVRALCGFSAALALAVGLTAQSRGGAVALAGALAAAVVIAVERGRFALTLGAVVLPPAIAATRLAAVDRSFSASDARTRGLLALGAAVLAAALVVGLAMLERRERFPFGGRERRVVVALFAAIAVLAVAAFAVRAGRPDTWLEARWDEFQNVHPAAVGDTSHFGTGFSNRYDYWRVAWHTFASHPAGGVGAGAFTVPWFRSRSVDENVTDAHSWEATAIAETGVIGFLLTAAVLLLPLAALRRARRGPGAWPLAATALGGSGVYFVLHASTDWLFRIPAIAVPGFLVLGALATGATARAVALPGSRERAVVALAALLAAAVVVPAYLATRETNRAEAQPTASDAALSDLRAAGTLNPFAAEPFIVRSELLAGAGEGGAAIRAAEDATRRDPNGWTAWVALADARRRAGDRAAARAALRRAAALNPRAGLLKAANATGTAR